MGPSRRAFQPRSGEPFNIVMSIQYRGTKKFDFKLSFDSTGDTKKAMTTLRLLQDLKSLGLPGFVSPDRVCGSSYGHPNTIEILFPNCDGRGAIERKFRLLEKRVVDHAAEMEAMQIRSLYVYFLPKEYTRLGERATANYVFSRPPDGWRLPPPRARSPPGRARTPPRGPRRRSPSVQSVRDSVIGGIREVPRSDSRASSSRLRSAEPSERPLNHDSSGNRASSSRLPLDQSAASPPISPSEQHLDPSNNDERASLRTQIIQSKLQQALQRQRIRELQKELAAEKDARRDAESRLVRARARTEEERMKVRDVRRECSDPFITPALLEAFCGVSSIAGGTL
ncbi:unnamed protein product [Peniophora sp. CBMAI 1063]|nr:unnamed protein product [Peniophora sp. CBMAI 1063]